LLHKKPKSLIVSLLLGFGRGRRGPERKGRQVAPCETKEKGGECWRGKGRKMIVRFRLVDVKAFLAILRSLTVEKPHRGIFHSERL